MKAGSRLDIVLEADLQNDRVIARKAMVYDVFGERFLISQTSPPLSRRHLGARVNASTVTTRGGQEPVRMGFPAIVLEYVARYPLSASDLVPAFVLKQEGKPAEINLRRHYRVRPTAESGLTLLADGVKVNLIDISIGGVQFSHRLMEPPLDYGEVSLTLCSGNRSFKIDGKIIRIDNPPRTVERSQDLEYVIVKFFRLDRETESFLSRKLLMIQRELLAEGKILLK